MGNDAKNINMTDKYTRVDLNHDLYLDLDVSTNNQVCVYMRCTIVRYAHMYGYACMHVDHVYCAGRCSTCNHTNIRGEARATLLA